MYTIAIDTETEVITPATPLPRLVCLSYAATEGLSDLVRREDARLVLEAIASAEAIVVTHNGAYDLGVLGRHDPSLLTLAFRLHDAGRIRDTKIREALHRIERGTFQEADARKPLTLEALAKARLGIDLDKGADGWKLRYGELRDVPLESWPERARAYAITDAATTLRLYEAQDTKAPKTCTQSLHIVVGWPDEVLQCRADFALKLMAAEGVITDPTAVDAFELGLLEQQVERRAALRAAGLVRVDGSRDTKKAKALVEAACASRGVPVPRTDPSDRFPEGQTKADEDAFLASGDPALATLAAYASTGKLLDTYVPLVRAGTEQPIYNSYNVLVASGRTSAYKPNWQNLPRAPGARECVVARPGRVFVACDYDVAELRALAQVCYSWFGTSLLREAFCAGRDPHLELGATILGISYEDAKARKVAGDVAVAEARQFAKVPNFGMAGGLGPDAFSSYARGYGYDVSRDRAETIREQWFAQWPEMRAYFRAIGQITGDLGDKCVTQFGSGRVRGGLSFTQAANTMFQGLVADFAKDALYQVARACYVEAGSSLYGARPVLFVHDEIIIEADESCAHEVAIELERLMIEVEQTWLPDVPAKAKAHLMRRWSKKAEAVHDAQGRLVPWEDRSV